MSKNSDHPLNTLGKQATNQLLMVRPAHFGFNPETSGSNPFQSPVPLPENTVEQLAVEEFDAMVEILRRNKVNVLVFEDSQEPKKTDAVFPNNWISLHPNGNIYLYPMFSETRRLERDADLIQLVSEKFKVNKVVDLSRYENQSKFLEGTGSIVFDHLNKVAYACSSVRTNNELFLSHMKELDYEPVFFHARDAQSVPIYHTNVMMFVGSEISAICLESIPDENERSMVENKLISTGHEVINLALDQMTSFAGNMLEVINNPGEKLLVLSQSAHKSLDSDQVELLERYYKLVSIPVKTIEEAGGGSVRCMIAEIFLPEK